MTGPESSGSHRLRGAIDGSEVIFDLAPGEHRVGSSPASNVRLPVAGVSRQHALLTATAGGLIVEDRGSRNGTFVDGTRVGRAAVPEGAEVRFGPVRLRVESVAIGDRELAIALETSPSSSRGEVSSTTSFDPTSQVTATEARAVSGSWLVLIDAFVDRLAVSAGGGLIAGLAQLAETLELEGCCLVDWPPGSEAVVVASAAALHEVPDRAAVHELWDADDGEVTDTAPRVALFDTQPPLSLAISGVSKGDAGAELRGLLCWGDFEDRRSSVPLLRTLFRLIDRWYPRTLGEVAAPSAATPARDSELVFPAGYRPLSSPPMIALYRQMRQLLEGDLSILIAGETGVGKERIARILHDSSDRREGPFVAINCAAIPADLLEAEMFGIAAGVATGVNQRPGKFQLAAGGSLFLDEIAELALPLQAKLLRALQEKEIHPVGASPRAIDVRVLAATNADLAGKIEAGLFRRDLYYRLAGFVLDVPPLRRCQADIPALVEHFLILFARQRRKRIRGITVKAMRKLTSLAWPGNVRELEHLVRALVFQCPEGRAIESSALSGIPRLAGAPPAIPLDPLALDARILELETALVSEALRRTGGNRTESARLLGISRNGLAKKLKRLGIEL